MTDPAANFLECSGVSCSIAGLNILSDCSFSVRNGDLIALVGPNGSGKTTLLRSVAGIQPCVGSIVSQGINIKALNPSARAQVISYLPQNGQVHWPMRVEEIIALGLLPKSPHGGERDISRQEAVHAAMLRCSVDHLAGRIAMNLSGGERARVLLARALVGGSKVLLADEPLASLDPKYQLSIMQALRNYADAGAGVIAVLHDISFGLRFANRVILLSEGKIVGDGPGEQLLSQGLFDNIFGVRFEPILSPANEILGLRIAGT